MAAQAEEQQSGGSFILEHIIDHHELHLGPLHIPLPHIEFFGIDMSITGHLVMMWVASLLLILTLTISTKRRGLIPSGFANAIEAIAIFIRDDIAVPNFGERDSPKYMPFLMTVFFFILFCNLLGLIPFGQTPTGNINVTATLAGISFAMMLGAGIKHNGLFGFFKGLDPSQFANSIATAHDPAGTPGPLDQTICPVHSSLCQYAGGSCRNIVFDRHYFYSRLFCRPHCHCFCTGNVHVGNFHRFSSSLCIHAPDRPVCGPVYSSGALIVSTHKEEYCGRSWR